MGSPEFRQAVLENAPGDPATNPYRRLLPTKRQIEDSDFHKVTIQGQEAWEYRHPDENFCVDVWEDDETFGSYVGLCDSD